MLLPAILGTGFRDAYIAERSGQAPDFSFFSRPHLLHLLKAIIASNDRLGQLTDGEAVVQLFLTRAAQLFQNGVNLYDNPDVALSQWRTLYELTVCFRVWSQTITIEGNGTPNDFFGMAKRFSDYGTLERIRVNNYQWTHEERAIEKAYHLLPDYLQLTNEYDWLNPAFGEKEMRRRPNRWHNSFRDLVNRSRELNWDLSNMLDYYVKSSTILHFNPSSLELIAGLDKDEVAEMFNAVLQTFLIDYLDLVICLYPENDTTKSLLATARGELRRLKLI